MPGGSAALPGRGREFLADGAFVESIPPRAAVTSVADPLQVTNRKRVSQMSISRMREAMVRVHHVFAWFP
jgi:hypothetical protein